MLLELGHDAAGQWDRAARFLCLWLPEADLSANVGGRLVDAHPGAEHIDPAAPQTSQFTPPEPAERAQCDRQVDSLGRGDVSTFGGRRP